MANFKPEYTHSLVEKRPKNPKTTEELREESKKNDFVKRGKKYAKEKISKNSAINKAQEVKENFENRMNAFRDSAEESARKPALKQEYGEPNKAFLERQRAANKTEPENPQKMGLKDAAKQHAKDYGKKQLGKGADYAKRKGGDILAKNPKLAATADKIKAKADAIKNKVALLKNKKDNFKKRIKALKDKYNVKKLLKKKIEDKAKQLALKIAQATARLALQIIISVISALSAVLIKLLVVVLIIVVIIVAIDYTCDSNPFFDAACSYFIGI